MYRSVRSDDIECDVDLYVAPSPRAVTNVVRVALVMAVVPCVIGSVLLYLVHIFVKRHYYEGIPYGTFSSWSSFMSEVVLFELILLPIFPVLSFARLIFWLRKRPRGKLRIEGKVLGWMSSARSRVVTTAGAYCTGVRIGSEVRVVAMATGADTPVSLTVRDSATLRRVESSLNTGMSSFGSLKFHVLTGRNARSGRLRQRSGLVLFLVASWAFFGLIGDRSELGQRVFPIVFGPGLCIALVLWGLSWVAVLRESPAQKMAINATEICIDGEVVCSLKDVIKLTITEDACLEIAASRIPEGKRLIKPWQPGYVDELELIKATIEAFQARAAENAPGASPPNPQP